MSESANQESEQLTDDQEFIQTSEIEQEIIAENNKEDIYEDDEEHVEIDMSNNSITYFDKHTDSVFCVMHHPTLPLVCTGGADNMAHLWTSHSQPPKFAGSLKHTESVIGGGFTPDGNFLITGDMNGQILIHKSRKNGSLWNKCGELREVDEVIWLKVHPTISGIFSFGGTDGSVWCYQINNDGSLEQIMSGFVHQQDCTMGEFINVEEGNNNLTLVTCSVDNSIVGWNCYQGTPYFKISSSDLKGLDPHWISLSKAPIELTNGTPIISCGSNNGILVIINGSNGAVLHLTNVIELQSGQEELDGSIESISWSNKLPMMAIGLVSGNVLLYDTMTWRVRHKFVLEDSVTKLLFDEITGFNFFVSCINGKIYEFDSRTGKEIYVCVGHNMGVLDFIVINGKKLITAGDEGVSLVFQLP